MLLAELERLPPKLQALILAEEAQWRQKRRKFFTIFPDEGPHRRELYPKHLLFFKYGATHRQRGFMAANRVGKTVAALYETSCHMTGIYPDWWVGRRFNRPVKVWICGDTSKSVREGVQEKLLGPFDELGTGILPGEKLVDKEIKQGEALDWIRVSHALGGRSVAYFKSYDQGREAYQYTEVDIIVLDEEPPADIYEECVTRTLTTNGIVMLPFTPLNGVTDVVRKFMREEGVLIEGAINNSRALIQCTWEDVPHLDENAKRELEAEYPEHMRKARTQGQPIMGSGMVFPVVESQIVIDPLEIVPETFLHIGGMDFGIDHPFGATELLWDREEDTIHVAKDFTAKDLDAIPSLTWPKLKTWGEALPWAWPHDGLQRDKISGKQISKAYEETGFKMLPVHAQFEDKSFGVEAGILQMLERMKTGRWKVWRNCQNWLREYRGYHRKEGLIVKIGDDVISASRYAYMMRRYGRHATRVTGKAKLRIHVGL